MCQERDTLLTDNKAETRERGAERGNDNREKCMCGAA